MKTPNPENMADESAYGAMSSNKNKRTWIKPSFVEIKARQNPDNDDEELFNGTDKPNDRPSK